MKNALLVLAMAAAIALLCTSAYFAGHAAGVADALDWVRDRYGDDAPLPLIEVARTVTWQR
jgi:hypothetical protein